MKPTVYLMLGLPGSGKTTFSKELAQTMQLPRFSLDEEYARLGGDLTSHHWNMEIEATANEHIKTRIKELIQENKSAILDFCPWRREERIAYRQFIESYGAISHVYYFDVPLDELGRRLAARNNNSLSDTHIVTPDMLEAFTLRFDPPMNETFERVDT
jgi:predicted kinase